MVYIRQLNSSDDLAQYMNCVKDLNNEVGSICNVEQMKRGLMNRHNNVITYVILKDETIVAAATCLFEKKIRYNKLCCHIEDVGVVEEYRNSGFGRMIVDYCLEQATNKGCYKAKLHCDGSLVDFYTNLGFKKFGSSMEMELKNS